jgi:predicted amidohydrolase YtcJ
MSTLLIANGTLVTDTDTIAADIFVRDGKIAVVGSGNVLKRVTRERTGFGERF